ncbi:MAG TPA: tyrosine-type recombinase/integrase [Chitinophagaceae bacterium]
MQSLPNGCRCGKISVSPKNWKNQNASLSRTWYITYRFYDPTRPNPKQVTIKGMNDFKTHVERKSATETLLENELNLLKQGYNPNNSKIISEALLGEIDPFTPFILALRSVMELMKISPKTKLEIRSVIKGVEAAAVVAGIESMPISSVTRRHMKRILLICKDVVPGWSDNRHNSYRSYLMILFNELIEHEATEIDPISKIKKFIVDREARQVLTPEERKAVDEHLRIKTFSFWRFTHIFFHSGARESELMKVRGLDVDLKKQRYRVTIMKGGRSRVVWKVIKTIVLPLWMDVISEAKPSDYLFAKGLKPGPVAISASQISRRWRRHVKAPPEKGGLGIQADFYSLKHLNLDEISAALDARAAAKMASHTTPVITLKHYLVTHEEREMEDLMKINNSFS